MDNHDYYLAVAGMQGDTGKAQHYGLTVADFRFETTGGTMIDPATPPTSGPTYGDLVVTFEGQQGLSEFLRHLIDKTPVDAMTLYGQDQGSDVYRLTLAGARVTDVRTDVYEGYSTYSVTLSPAAAELETAPLDPAEQQSGANTTRWNFVLKTEGLDLTPATGLPRTAASVPAQVDYCITIDGVAQGDSLWRKDGFLLSDFSFEASHEALADGSISDVAQFSSLRASLSPATYAALLEIMAARGSLSGVDIYGRARDGLHRGDVVYHAALDTVYVSGIAQAGAGFEASFAYKDLTVTTKQVDGAGAYVADDVFTGKGVQGSVGNHAGIGAPADADRKFFFAIEGLDGDSLQRGFENMMEVRSFGFAHDAQVDFEAGVPAGKPDFGEVELSFSSLENLTQFLVALNSGATMSKATLYGTKLIEGISETFYALTLANFKVAAVAQNLAEGGHVYGYSVTLAPRSFEIAVAPQDSKTGKILAFDEYGYDTLSGQRVRLDPAVGRDDGIRGVATDGSVSYLTIDGITGDSTTHKGAFEIYGFAYDATSSGLAGTKPDFSVLTTAFASNSALAAVLRGLATGTHLTGVDIYTETTGPGSGKNGPAYHLELDVVFVTGLSEDGNDGFRAALRYRDMKVSTFDYDQVTGTVSTTAGDVFVGKGVEADGGGVPLPSLSGSFLGKYVLAVEGVQGTIAGKTGHNGLAVEGFAFTAENGQTFQGGTGAARPTNVGDVTVAISDQQGLTQFLSALQTRTALSKATLYGQVDFGKGAMDTYALTLADFQVTSVREDQEKGYTVTLAPRQFEIASAPVNYDARTVGTFSEYGYDVATGRAVNLTAATGVAPDARGPAGTAIRYYAIMDWSSPTSTRPPIVGDSVLHPGAFELDGFVLDSVGRSAAVPLSMLRATFSTDAALTRLLDASTAGRSVDVDIYGVEKDANGNERIVQHVALDYALPNSIIDTQRVGFSINFTYLYSTVTSYDVSSAGAVRIGDEFTTGNHTPRDTGTRAVLSGAREDSAFAIAPASLLQGFTDADGDPLSVSQVTASNGTVRFDGTRYVVTPTAGFTGTVTLSYLVGDGHTTTPTTLAYDVAAMNHAPALTGPTATLPAGTEDRAYTVSLADLLRGFTDADGDTLAVSGVTADHGSVAANGAGGFTIMPAADYNGPLSLRYTVEDGQGGSTTASLGFVLAAANDAPVAADDGGFATPAGAPIRILKSTLLANDHDVDGDALLLTGVSAGTNGAVTMDGDVIVFTPTAGYEGAASFGYTVSDGAATAAATVRLTVTSAAPVTTYAPATSGDDVIDHGGSQVRWLVNGGGGNDTLIGGLANDSLNGGAGDDTIRGHAGKDVLTGGPGQDQLWGDSGADTFVFNAGDIASGPLLDEIMDFEGAGNGYDGAGDIIAFAGFATGATLTLDAARTAAAADPTAHYYQVASAGFQETIIVHYQGNAVLQAGDYWFY